VRARSLYRALDACDGTQTMFFSAATPKFPVELRLVVTLVQHRSPFAMHFFLDFIFQSLNTSFSCNKTALQIFP
jgi:hypothetical protein